MTSVCLQLNAEVGASYTTKKGVNLQSFLNS